MAIIKTDYMNEPTIGYCEYWAEEDADLETITPDVGDRCILKNGDLYFCFTSGSWDKIGGE